MNINIKRGQANIITIALLIVLIIALILILWVYINKTLKSSGNININLYNINLDIAEDSFAIDEEGKYFFAKIKRGSGGVIEDIGVVINGDQSYNYIIDIVPEPLETKAYLFDVHGNSNLREIIIYPIYKKSSQIYKSEKIEKVLTNLPTESEFIEIKRVELDNQCIPTSNCGLPGPCLVEYNLNDLIYEGVEFMGVQSRSCEGNPIGCSQIKLKEECDPKVLVKLKKVNSCDKEYIEVFDTNNNLIARLDSNENELNIQLLLNNEYTDFPYCNNNQQDCDEVGVDCGGSCSTPCI